MSDIERQLDDMQRDNTTAGEDQFLQRLEKDDPIITLLEIIDRLDKALTDAHARVDDLESDVERKDERISDLESMVDDYKSEIALLKEIIDNLRIELGEIGGE